MMLKLKINSALMAAILCFATMAHSKDDYSIIWSSTWKSFSKESNGLDSFKIEKEFKINDKSKNFKLSKTCFFKDQGIGENVTVSLEGNLAHFMPDYMTYEITQSIAKGNLNGKVCELGIKDQTEYRWKVLDDVTLQLDDLIYKSKASVMFDSKISGHKYMFSFRQSNGTNLTIVQDLTIPGKLKTTATCHFGLPITVSVEAPVVVNEEKRTLENPTEKMSDASYNVYQQYCYAHIPRRTIEFTPTKAGFFSKKDPLHPEGIEWVILE